MKNKPSNFKVGDGILDEWREPVIQFQIEAVQLRAFSAHEMYLGEMMRKGGPSHTAAQSDRGIDRSCEPTKPHYGLGVIARTWQIRNDSRVAWVYVVKILINS